jgi:hypothetical protein
MEHDVVYKVLDLIASFSVVAVLGTYAVGSIVRNLSES